MYQIETSKQAQEIARQTKNFKNFERAILWLMDSGDSAIASQLLKTRWNSGEFRADELATFSQILVRRSRPNLNPIDPPKSALSITSFRDEKGDIRDQPAFLVPLTPEKNWLMSPLQIQGKYDLSEWLKRHEQLGENGVVAQRRNEMLTEFSAINDRRNEENSRIKGRVLNLIKVNKELNAGKTLTFIVDARNVDVHLNNEYEIAVNERWLWGLQRLGVPIKVLYLINTDASRKNGTQVVELDLRTGKAMPFVYERKEEDKKSPIFFLSAGDPPPVPSSSLSPSNLIGKNKDSAFLNLTKQRLIWLSSVSPKDWVMEEVYEERKQVVATFVRQTTFIAKALQLFNKKDYGDLVLEEVPFFIRKAKLEALVTTPPPTLEEMRKVITSIRASLGENGFFIFIRLVNFKSSNLEDIIRQAYRYHRLLDPDLSEAKMASYISRRIPDLIQLPWVKLGQYPEWLTIALREERGFDFPEVINP